MEQRKMLYDINEKPPIPQWIILALQHVFAMFGATILVPILVNSQAGETVLTIPVALVSSGIGTLIYILCTKGKSPVYLGSSFAFIAPLVAAYAKGGISGAMTGIMAVGLIYVIFSILIRIIGKSWIDKLLPPLVIGPMIMIIGLGLAPSAVSQIGLNAETIEWKNIVVALVTFLTTVIVMVRGKGFLKIIPFLVGIVTGYIVSIILGMVDFSPVVNATFFSLPEFVIPIKDYALNFSVLLTIAPIALVTMAEQDRTLLGDGVATFIAGMLGGPANTTYGENTSVVGLTKVASVWVIGLAAILAICLGFLGKFTALVSTIPNPVLGGVSLILYGFIAVNGLKVLIQNQTDFSNPKNVVVASTMLVLGLGGAAIAINSGDLSITISGMSLAAVIGIVLNLILPEDKEAKAEAAAVADEKYIQKSELPKIKNSIKSEIKNELKTELKNELKNELKTNSSKADSVKSEKSNSTKSTKSTKNETKKK